MPNVVMFNFSYDIPVKLFSLNLLAMALFLAAPEVRTLADLLVPNRPTLPANFLESRPVFVGCGWSKRERRSWLLDTRFSLPLNKH
jgi:hypothetical protein